MHQDIGVSRRFSLTIESSIKSRAPGVLGITDSGEADMKRRSNSGNCIRTAVHVVASVILMALMGCASSPDVGESGWTPLFNGRDLTGWTVKCRPADRAREFWRVEDGAIVADSLDRAGHDYVWLVTDREYADFVLRLRFQAYRDSPGNSGVQVRSRYDDQANWLDGPQIDINPPDPWRTGMIWDETRQVNRWLSPPVLKGKWVDASMAAPGLAFHYAGEDPAWNDLEITDRNQDHRRPQRRQTDGL